MQRPSNKQQPQAASISRRRKILIIALLATALMSIVAIPLFLFTPLGEQVAVIFGLAEETQVPPPLQTVAFPKTTKLAISSQPAQVKAKYYYLIDGTSRQELIDYNGQAFVSTASTTKVMTALVAIQSGKLSCEVKIKQYILDHVVKNDSSNAALKLNDTFTVRELLYGLMLPSGGDAALAIAECVSGSEQAHVEQMNRLAQRLNLFQTRYFTVDGRPAPANYSTAADLVKLTGYALEFPEMQEVVKQAVYNLPATSKHKAYQWKNTNKLVGAYDGILGLKTGFTDDAGYCLMFAAKRDGRYLVGVILGSPTDDQRFVDTASLLNWGFQLKAA